jgi:16S rRNA (guanine527-N7)-methyltransferase
MLSNLLNKCLNILNINIDNIYIELLFKYWDYLLDKNNFINLISRQGTIEHKFINHLVDSLTPFIFDWPNTLELMDFGSGGGLPGIPLAICRPNWNITLVESKIKKSNFLSDVCKTLQLKNCNINTNYITNNIIYDIKFNLITVRAVGNIKNIVNTVYNLLEKDGILLLFKGPNYSVELNDALPYIDKYKIKFINKHTFNLPILDSERNLLFFKKL